MAERRAPRVRHRGLIQLLFAAMTNSFFTGFASGTIYKGGLKRLCSPGLNCYSCPGARLSCPIGALQAVLSGPGFQLSLYVTGFLLLVGALLGRLVCGFLCPFGMIQEWLYRIPFPWKKNRFRGDRALRYLKYAVLLVLVILMPMLLKGDAGQGSPAFCKYVCPAGTLEGAVPLVLLKGAAAPALPEGPLLLKGAGGAAALQPQYQTGFLFSWKMGLLALTLLLSIAVWRPFCKYLCPLGAVYGLMNPLSLYRLQMAESACIHCGRCSRACRMALSPEHRQNEAECVRCGDCVNACPTGALSMGFGKAKAAPYPSERKG